MKNNITVMVEDCDLHKLVLDRLVHNGFNLGGESHEKILRSKSNILNTPNYKLICIPLDHIGHVIGRFSDTCDYILPKQWDEFWEVVLKSPKPITVGEYTVAFSKDSIKVGCQTVTFETVKEIYDRMLELRK